MTSTTTPATPAADAPDRIAELRSEIDDCDAQLVELLHRRVDASRQIGELRAANGGMRLSLAREREVLARFRDALGPDGATLGMLLLRLGRGRL